MANLMTTKIGVLTAATHYADAGLFGNADRASAVDAAVALYTKLHDDTNIMAETLQRGDAELQHALTEMGALRLLGNLTKYLKAANNTYRDVSELFKGMTSLASFGVVSTHEWKMPQMPFGAWLETLEDSRSTLKDLFKGVDSTIDSIVGWMATAKESAKREAVNSRIVELAKALKSKDAKLTSATRAIADFDTNLKLTEKVFGGGTLVFGNVSKTLHALHNTTSHTETVLSGLTTFIRTSSLIPHKMRVAMCTFFLCSFILSAWVIYFAVWSDRLSGAWRAFLFTGSYFLIYFFVLSALLLFGFMLVVCLVLYGYLIPECIGTTSHSYRDAAICLEVTGPMRGSAKWTMLGVALNMLLSYNMLAAYQALHPLIFDQPDSNDKDVEGDVDDSDEEKSLMQE